VRTNLVLAVTQLATMQKGRGLVRIFGSVARVAALAVTKQCGQMFILRVLAAARL
jgi:hypothetical protein